MHRLTDIRRMRCTLGFSTMFRNRACRLLSTAQEQDLLRGRSIEAMAAGSVYAVCRCDGRPQTVDDVAQVARVSVEKVQHGYDVLNRELGLLAPPIKPERFLPQFRSVLDLSQAVERRASALLAQGEPPETNRATPGAWRAGRSRCRPAVPSTARSPDPTNQRRAGLESLLFP